MRRTRNEETPPPLRFEFMEEILIVIGLVLILIALWPWVGRGALVVPGVVLLWFGLPSRSLFLVAPAVEPESKEPRR